jgi:DNA polymerase-1
LPSNAIYGFAQTLRKILKDYSPDYIGVAFDVKGPTYRHELYEEYKVERPAMPDDLGVQIPYIKKLVTAFDIPVFEKQGYEADDVIGTLAKKFSGSGLRVLLITNDKDMFQLVGEDCRVLDYINDKEYGRDDVMEKFGVEPARMTDLVGLAGDPTDNIPGVPGVGVKTAAKLLNRFGTLEEVLTNSDQAPGKKLKANLAEYRDQAVLSKELATLHADVPIVCDISSLRYEGPDLKALEGLLKELEFVKLIKEVIPVDVEAVKRKVVLTEKELEGLVSRLKKSPLLAITLHRAEEEGDTIVPVTGIALSSAPGQASYLPLLESGGEGLSEGVIMRHLKKLMEDEGVKKSSHNTKDLSVFFSTRGVALKGVVMDTSIASYLLNPTKFVHTLENVAYAYLGVGPERAEREGVQGAAAVACSEASMVLRLAGVLERELIEAGLTGLFRDIELPLSGVLADMELSGVKVERHILEGLSREIEGELKALERVLYGAAGYRFNINSPKQLSSLLFEKLKLKPIKKTKTGYSTDETVLTALVEYHEIPRIILNYRQLAKLKGTYVDAMLTLINPATGRIHTSFNQTVTATGRLSSSRPNLQNIPIRNEFARKIREAFVAEKDYTLLSADYSQIELRLVAHFSKDPVLLDAFRRAKAINFGIIYGMGPYGLSSELGIKVAEAKEYIDAYFAHYSTVKEFIDRTVKEAKKRGYTETFFGRRRFIPELMSPNEGTIRFGERMAINTPIQGSAADIIKAAMIKIHKRLKQEALRSRMILQIHDELLFEVHEDEKRKVKELVTEEMEGVTCLEVPIKVNLKSGRNWRSVE